MPRPIYVPPGDGGKKTKQLSEDEKKIVKLLQQQIIELEKLIDEIHQE